MTAGQPSTASADPMAPNAETWKGIDLSPITPLIRAAIVRVFTNSAHEALTDTERAMCLALAEKWSAL